MNKARRHELKMLKYKKRLKKMKLLNSATPIGVEKGVHYNFTGYRNHSNPCSCPMCSPYKYERAKMKRKDYDIEKAAKAIEDGRLPDTYAESLRSGL